MRNSKGDRGAERAEAADGIAAQGDAGTGRPPDLLWFEQSQPPSGARARHRAPALHISDAEDFDAYGPCGSAPAEPAVGPGYAESLLRTRHQRRRRRVAAAAVLGGLAAACLLWRRRAKR